MGEVPVHAYVVLILVPTVCCCSHVFHVQLSVAQHAADHQLLSYRPEGPVYQGGALLQLPCTFHIVCSTQIVIKLILLGEWQAVHSVVVFVEIRPKVVFCKTQCGLRPTAAKLIWSAARYIFAALQFTPGPGVDAITVQALKSMSWDWIDNIITPRPQVAPKLPLPPGLSVPIQQTQAGALVQAVDSCSTFEVGRHAAVCTMAGITSYRPIASTARQWVP